jgi:uncharacterized protein YrrD
LETGSNITVNEHNDDGRSNFRPERLCESRAGTLISARREQTEDEEMTTDAKQLLNMPVVATETGSEMGSVDQVLFQPGAHQLYGLVVKSREKSDPLRLVRAQNVKSYGDQAVTVTSEEDAVAFESDKTALEIAPASGHLGGRKVLTEQGNEVGKVETVIINGDGSVKAYRTAGGLLGLASGTEFTPAHVVSVGDDAIIVRDDSVRTT